MAAGEYVPVCAQADTEESDLLREKQALASDFEGEVSELAQIYRKRGVEQEISVKVAQQLMAHDALGAHARDENGISELTQANPLVAAFSSALSFIVGALLPLLTAFFYSEDNLSLVVAVFSLVFLAGLGAVSSYLSGAKIYKGMVRVTFWGALAMTVTAFVGIAIDGAIS